MAYLAVGLAKSVVEGTLSQARAAIQEEATLRQSARRDLKFITGEFEMMRSFLNVANTERVENPVVRTWVQQIRELAYDVEDCIELVVHLDKDKSSFWFRISGGCLPWITARMPALDQAVDEIEQLKIRVADVSTRNVRYSLISDTGSKPVAQQLLSAVAGDGSTAATANMLAEARDAGGGGDLSHLITKNKVELPVISVWGSGGDHGTTSVIMKTYEDPEISKNFAYRAWVKLTHPFSPHDFVRSLMLQFCPAEGAVGMDVLTMMQATQEDLLKGFKKIVREQRYLLVVEGLSNMAEWHALRKFFPGQRKGSWIIVSTQQHEIASLCVGHSYQILELKQFSADHSVCALFNKGSHGVGDRNKQTVVGDSSDVACVAKIEGSQSETDNRENSMVLYSAHAGQLPEIDGSHSKTDKGEKSMVEASAHAGHVEEIEGSHSETDKGEKPMLQYSTYAHHVPEIKGTHSKTDKGEKPLVEESSLAGHMPKIQGSHSKRDKGKKPMVESSVHVEDVWEIEGSSRDGDKGKKPVHEESFLLGRESEMKELREYPGKARISSCQVISVWGIAGVGKSALVKKLYDDARRDTNQFMEYCWVDVSHPFNSRDFHRSLPLDFHHPESSWLIVIDDIQSKKEWDLMQTSLVPRSSRSVIIVITTEASIAAYCSNGEELVFNVKGLESAAASSLFKKVCKTNSSVTKALEDLEVKELILKCGGLPKVIVAIAGVLAKQTVTLMDTVVSLNQRFMHHLETKPSYDSLRDLFGWMDSYFRTCPDSLKPCIFYLSIFPRDHLIRRRRLVRRFIAEGYSRDDAEESAEENGEKQFSELIDLSVIQQVPHLFTNSLNTRMMLCQVNGFIREYIIPRRKQENLVFELGGTCALTTQRTGRHLIILDDWNRDIIVFESMDFSRLRSLTVIGKWKPFFVSEKMRLLRVLDLEDASGIEYEDLENIVKWLCRLKFLSLRGQREIHHLPDNMDDLRQLQTLDVRGTSIVTLPENITKLQNLQYIRAGNSDIPTSTSPSTSSWVPEFCRCHRIVGVRVPTGIRKLTALHTLGVVNVSASGRKAMVKALKKLTQLHKLGVSGINRKNCKDFFSAIKGHVHLESLSVRLDKDNQGCCLDDQIPLPWKNLQSLKLYGLQDKLPLFEEKTSGVESEKLLSSEVSKLRKLDLELVTLTAEDTAFLGKVPKLCILRLRVKQASLHFITTMHGRELCTYEKVKILEISSSSRLLSVEFGSETMRTLELLKLDCSSGTSYNLAGLDSLPELKEVLLIACNDEEFKTNVVEKLSSHPKKPVLKLQELPLSS